MNKDNITILIIEDDDGINNLLTEYFKTAGYNVIQAFSGTEGLLYINNSELDLIVLDLMLPGMSGEDVLKNTRENSTVPVIVISGKVDISDKVSVLEMGADDYIIKPFDRREVLVRVHSALRRSKQFNEVKKYNELVFEKLKLNKDSRMVSWAEEPIELTQTEFDILACLMEHPREVLSRDRLYSEVRGEDFISDDNAINVHMSHLRQKIKRISGATIIETVWGIGYKLVKMKSTS